MTTPLASIAERLQAVLEDEAPKFAVGGAVVGVAVGDEDVAFGHGSANLNTGEPFTTDTGFLLGSVTKVMVTTALLRLVERGEVDLDAPAMRYVPEFTLRNAEAAEAITVRMLVNHTNGIDADTLWPNGVRGRDASRSYTQFLPDLDVLFEPGTCIHYTNPGFVLAARVIEEVTGLAFEKALEQELFAAAGMERATLLQTQALLHRTAVGAFANPDGTLRATGTFTLPESAVGAGSTTIVTVADMLAFGRMHLRDGVAPNGTRVLSSESTREMQTVTFDLGVPQAPPMGLGWWLPPIAGTTAACHLGGSPGGISSFCILPEHDAVVISFATGPGGLFGPGGFSLHDVLHNAVIEELTGQKPTAPLDLSADQIPAQDFAGEYVSFEKRLVIEAEGDELRAASHYVAYNDDQRATHDVYEGSSDEVEAASCARVGPNAFAIAGTHEDALAGLVGRLGLLSKLSEVPGRRAGVHQWLRYTPKVG